MLKLSDRTTNDYILKKTSAACRCISEVTDSQQYGTIYPDGQWNKAARFALGYNCRMISDEFYVLSIELSTFPHLVIEAIDSLEAVRERLSN